MKGIHSIAFLLLVIGGVNWLLVGVTPGGWDVGQLFGGQGAMISRVVYILVGLSAIYEIFGHSKCCKKCSAKGGSDSTNTVAGGQGGGMQM